MSIPMRRTLSGCVQPVRYRRSVSCLQAVTVTKLSSSSVGLSYRNMEFYPPCIVSWLQEEWVNVYPASSIWEVFQLTFPSEFWIQIWEFPCWPRLSQWGEGVSTLSAVRTCRAWTHFQHRKKIFWKVISSMKPLWSVLKAWSGFRPLIDKSEIWFKSKSKSSKLTWLLCWEWTCSEAV